jgi:predicted dehydrogenase
VRQARALLESGALGSLLGVEVFQGAAAGEGDLPAGSGAHWKAALPGGVLYDVAPHPAYLVHGFVGPAREVHAVTRVDEGGALREVRAVIDGERALGGLTISLESRPFMCRVALYGSVMTVEVNLNNMTLVARRTRQVPKLVGKVLPNLDEAAQLVRATIGNTIEFLRGRQRYYPGMGAHFRALYDALAAGAPPPVSAEDGREAVRLLERIWRIAGAETAVPLRLVARA